MASAATYMAWTCWPSRRTGGERCCVRLDTPIQRPDPAIYSQREFLEAGISPTWDNPNIVSCELPSNDLLPEVIVTVTNLSLDCPALGALISLFLGPFGIGMQLSLQGQMTVSLAPSQQLNITFPLSQAILNPPSQEVNLTVTIQHPSDANLANNVGSQNLMGFSTAASGRNFIVSVPVRNAAATPQTISLEMMPNQLTASIATEVQLGPLSQTVIPLSLTVPAAAHGTPVAPTRLDATLVARNASGDLLDGVTYAVFVDN
jgi:hypothetical protein